MGIESDAAYAKAHSLLLLPVQRDESRIEIRVVG